MARNYFNLDEAEIDNILMINLFPKRRERINFSDRGAFEDILMPEITKRQATLDFMANLISLHRKKAGLKKAFDELDQDAKLQFHFDILFSPPKFLKLAVLITLDSIEE